MDLRFFFKYEQGASAFLATVLERKDLRNDFFDMLADEIGRQELASSFKAMRWTVDVEAAQVDIRLTSGEKDAWVILVENKVQAGSKQPGQLLGYYSRQIQSKPAARVVAVYLAPGGVGESEVQEVRSSEVFRQRSQDEKTRDFAVQVPWEELLDLLSGIDTDDFIRSCVKEIGETIKRARQEMHPNIGERADIYRIACRVRDALRQTIRMGDPWRTENSFILATHGTNLTLWFVLAFDVDAEANPIRLFDGDNMRLTVRSKLKLSEKASRTPELNSRWDKLRHGAILDVPQVGSHKLEDKWFVFERELVATPDEMLNKLTNMGVSLLHVVKDWGTRT